MYSESILTLLAICICTDNNQIVNLSLHQLLYNNIDYTPPCTMSSYHQGSINKLPMQLLGTLPDKLIVLIWFIDFCLATIFRIHCIILINLLHYSFKLYYIDCYICWYSIYFLIYWR